MSRPIIFGEIEGIKEGHKFNNRREMMPTSFHRSWAYGIDGNKKEGAAAIVLSGGFEDDDDRGDEILYSGAGGREPNSKIQTKDQTWENTGNAGLLISKDKGLPVRVIRGHTHKSKFSPQKGYEYAGLYSVVDSWMKTKDNGFKACMFRLVYCGDNVNRKTIEEIELDYSKKKKTRKKGTVVRIVRDTKLAADIKNLYNFECQVCGQTINTISGRYAEGAHIKPLGNPHNGDDNPNNILCLCPNHHVMLDKGCFSIDDQLNLLGINGRLTIDTKHKLNVENLKYHRECHGYD